MPPTISTTIGGSHFRVVRPTTPAMINTVIDTASSTGCMVEYLQETPGPDAPSSPVPPPAIAGRGSRSLPGSTLGRRADAARTTSEACASQRIGVGVCRTLVATGERAEGPGLEVAPNDGSALPRPNAAGLSRSRDGRANVDGPPTPRRCGRAARALDGDSIHGPAVVRSHGTVSTFVEKSAPSGVTKKARNFAWPSPTFVA